MDERADLVQVGLGELVAESEDDYVRIAGCLADDLASLSNLRKRLRQQVNESVLCDGPGLAREVEGVYRDIWQQWCADTSGA